MTSAPSPVDSPEAQADPAAAGHEAPPAPRARPRLTWRIVVPVVTAAAGLMFAMSFRAAQGSDLRADRDLPQLIMEGDAKVAAKAAQLDTLRAEVDTLSKTSAPSDERLASLTKRADALAATAATTKVRGAALEVALDDAHRTVDSLPDGFTADDIVVHQQDVQAVVNALWASGAEAMMIQDQRVISTSAVRCVGNTLILQGRVYAPPYRRRRAPAARARRRPVRRHLQAVRRRRRPRLVGQDPRHGRLPGLLRLGRPAVRHSPQVRAP
jgi:uncharacterized protein YlxW (UPF0749 family)